MSIPPDWITARGDGPPVLLVHGWTGFKEVFTDLSDVLVAAGYRAVAPDLPGWGARREHPGLTRDAAGYAGALGEVLAEVGPCAVVGHSLGGQVALQLAAAHPELVTRLVVMSTPVVPAPRRWTVPRTLVQMVGLPGIGKSVAFGAIAVMKRRPGRAVEAYRRSVAEPDRLLAQERMMAIADRAVDAFRATPSSQIADSLWRIARTDLRSLLASIRQPVLVIVGERDWSVNPANSETLAKALPDARLVRIPDVAHLPFLERPDIVNEAILGFLAGDEA